MMKMVYIISTILLIFLIISCTPQIKSPSEPNNVSHSPSNETIDSGYPVVGYPTRDNTEASGYPISEDIHDFVVGPKFTINTPVFTSDEIVTGSGPAGVPIKLVNVSRVGLLLSETTIDSEGNFIFYLTNPLESDHLIGIQLGSVEGTDINGSDFLYSDTYYERPFVGILFDMVLVQKDN